MRGRSANAIHARFGTSQNVARLFRSAPKEIAKFDSTDFACVNQLQFIQRPVQIKHFLLSKRDPRHVFI